MVELSIGQEVSTDARRRTAAIAVALVVGAAVLHGGQPAHAKPTTGSIAIKPPARQPLIIPVKPAIASPAKPLVGEVPPTEAPTATHVAELYGVVGRALGRLQQSRGRDATIDLWPRFRYIRINDAIASPDSRRETHRLLDQLQRDVAARR